MMINKMELYDNFMAEALKQARIAGSKGEVPIGAVITRGSEIISVGYNKRETHHNALLHAEIDAISDACKKLNSWRLRGCALTVTLEPCPMCAGAIINSRIDTVIFGASDKKAGACGSVIDLFACPFNHRPVVVSGVLEEECTLLLKNFFERLRKQ